MVLLLMVFSDLLVMENWGISFLLFISYLAFFCFDARFPGDVG